MATPVIADLDQGPQQLCWLYPAASPKQNRFVKRRNPKHNREPPNVDLYGTSIWLPSVLGRVAILILGSRVKG